MISPNSNRAALIFTAILCASLTSRGQDRQGTITVKDYFGDDRVINDGDGDGWDDLWTILYPNFEGRSKTTDTDGDGVSDYDEMILWRDPMVKGPLPQKPTAEEIVEAEKQAEIAKVENQARKVREWPARQAALSTTLRPLFDGKQADPDDIRNDSAVEKEAAVQRLADANALSAETERTLDAIAAKYGIEREGTDKNDKGWTLVGESPTRPLLMTTQNARSANTTSADDLWPTSLASQYTWQNSSLSRSLTGSGVTTSIFEAGNTPGILANHQEFQGRVTQIDTVTAGNHATAVADTIAGGGVLDVIRNGSNYGKMLRGVAYQSSVRGHSLTAFPTNSTASVSGGQRFSNHSYNLSGGWGTVTDGTNTYWFWPVNNFAEEPRFGMYSSSESTGLSSADLDSFVRSNLIQLPIYSSGNPNNYGPGTDIRGGYFILVNSTYVISSIARDWYNGDDGGYDTVLSPATAKNVLAVGSVLDVNGPTVSLSDFSGTGPTDDGRIKPDVVAVGQRNPNLGQGTSLFLASAGSTSSYYNGVTLDSQGNASMQGTSFAAPQVTGALALAQQRKTELYPTAGPWLASTWRSLSIHFAADIGYPGPDYLFGWGIFDAVGVVEGIENDAANGRGSMIKEFEVIQGQSRDFLVTLPAGTDAMFTLAWDDPAGSPSASDTVVDSQTKMLVNDLDLIIVDQDSAVIHYPWILNPDLSGKSATLRGAAAVNTVVASVIPKDDRNNVERVDIPSAVQTRTFKVTVAPQGIIQGGSQKVSLVLSGATPSPPTNISFASTQNPSNTDEMALTLATDPGAFFTLTSTIDFVTWTDVPGSSFLATGTTTTVLVNKNPTETKRFWRLRRGQ